MIWNLLQVNLETREIQSKIYQSYDQVQSKQSDEQFLCTIALKIIQNNKSG